ncbi:MULTISPECIES: hypothetical protein [Streptosporangium]|uniref:Uncharacterized protein n=1 Tax=Streptosporangium brasiliense TaxID=47480 RepID=A0ABT9RNT6_9ACTN|nr:hypothetical protein [Streptosporangium brasiliense]MDP9870364.1 hypothetical protein [Streptosporangium brasiliense]
MITDDKGRPVQVDGLPKPGCRIVWKNTPRGRREGLVGKAPVFFIAPAGSAPGNLMRADLPGLTGTKWRHADVAALEELAETILTDCAATIGATLSPPAPEPGAEPAGELVHAAGEVIHARPVDKMADNRAVVTFCYSECRHCPERSEASEEEQVAYTWQTDHEEATGHRNYWVYSAQRGTARIFRI